MEIELDKPKAITVGVATELFTQGSDIRSTIEALENGRFILITERYSNGLLLLRELKSYLNYKLPQKTFQDQRCYRGAYRRLSHQILIEIINHELAVKKSPSIGWLKKLYPENSNFLLPFPQIQGLNSSWQWYIKGVSIPVLRNKIHPYYGTYFPTRFEHLELFDQWLKRYMGDKKTAIDVGIGCGILSFQMIKYGFQKVYGTDTNPNAIVGLTEFMGDTKLSRKIELDFAPLFGKWSKACELIVFNPPWLPESYDLDRMDEAIYYNETLFPNFFFEAQARLLPHGRLLLLFSNLAQITLVCKDHPIAKELEEGGRFVLEHCFKKQVKAASNKSKRNQNWRAQEEVELWVLKHRL